MKIFKPDPLYGCKKCEHCYQASDLIWTAEGWFCDICADFYREVIGRDDNGKEMFEASKSPEWDGKTLEEYLIKGE